MKKETRIKEIQKIVDLNQENPFGKTEIPWEDDLQTMKVYKIPLDLLVYNKYNGRILSRTKSLEKQKYNIDVETDIGKKLIEKLLWESKIDKNKRTLESIAYHEQQKIGIITKDGIVIDGNRRVMMLNKIMENDRFKKKYNYFKAVVLPVTSEENPIEIEELETKFQMGEDEKLGYNATEKYLKAKGLYLQLTNSMDINLNDFNKKAIDKISDWMGEPESEIKKYLNTMAIMDEYLEYYEYDGIYTQLDSREDQFLSLTKWLNSFYENESKKGFDGYVDTDVDDLKAIAFDYLRIRNKYDGKEFRNLAEGQNDKHFFGNKHIWDSFHKNHFDILSRLPEEAEIEINSNNLKKHLDSRDSEFFENSKFGNEDSEFLENLFEHKQLIGYSKAAKQPEKLVKRATQAFESIKTNHSSFSKPEVQKLVKELGDRVINSLQKNSPSSILAHLIDQLKLIDIDKIPENEIEEVQNKSKEIQQICYRIYKSL